MPRGNTPRQPSRSGRHEGARPPKGAMKGATAKKVPSRIRGSQAPATTRKAAKPAAPKKKSASGYDPLAPERVRQIIAELDQLYPKATCALTHRSAW
jgi:hypothetical protein